MISARITPAVVVAVLFAAGLLGVMLPMGSMPGRVVPSAEARGRTALRSTLIYPPQTIALRMNHSHPAHVVLRCERCHEGASQSERAEDLLIPREASCEPCHADRTDRANAAAETCGYCHVGYGEDGDLDVPRSSFPTPRIRFAHKRHSRAGIRCVDCHRGISRATLGTRAHLPDMRTCLGCHQRSESASDRCETCHLQRADGRLRTRFGDQVMNPPVWLGMHHDRDFIVRHRWVAADRSSECTSCHAENDCADCHDGRIRPMSVHPGDFLTRHAQMARLDEPRCQTCHSSVRFCGECHARLGFSSFSAPNARAGGRYHPPSAVWVEGPNMHGREARRSMTTCASCHAEEDCVQCHGSVGIGAGRSPHPPGFRNRCGRFLRQNPRACRTCHQDGDPALDACR